MPRSRAHKSGPPPIRVTISHEGKETIAGPFTDSFEIGRDDDCEVSVHVNAISRRHASVSYEEERWWITDLNSSNGTYFDGERIERHAIEGTETFRFAKDGPLVRFALTEGFRPKASTVRQSIPTEHVIATPQADRSIDDIAAHYLSDESNRPAGEHTMMIRKAFKSVQAEQKKRFSRTLQMVIGAAVVVIAVVSVLLFLSEQKRKEGEEQLTSFLHQIKEMELAVANVRAANPDLQTPEQAASLATLENQLRSLNENYEATIVEYGIRRRLNPEEQLIHRMAVIFRESESEIPPGFVGAVREKIHDFWLQPGNVTDFQDRVSRAEREGYTGFIVDELRHNGLPPEFFYLAFQESRLDPTQVAYVNTRWGWAKGMWQFIPATAQRYDLAIGPLWEEKVFDPADERHNFEKSTVAATEYLAEIYRTLAQASGLLVLASYNWGEFGVARRLEALPDPEPFQGMEMDPVSRSYWRFYTEYEDRIPDETRDYVLKIFSLAVIGSNPRFFGIEMDDPLAKYR